MAPRPWARWVLLRCGIARHRFAHGDEFATTLGSFHEFGKLDGAITPGAQAAIPDAWQSFSGKPLYAISGTDDEHQYRRPRLGTPGAAIVSVLGRCA